MIKCEVIEEFTLEKFDELKNLVRAREDKNQNKKLYLKDTFECDKEMADYLTGGNSYKKPYVKIIEIIPVEEKPVEEDLDNVNEAEMKEVKPKKKRKK